MEQEKFPWEGKKTANVVITMTPAERDEVAAEAKRNGGMSISVYLRRLHHKAMGRIQEGGEK